MPPDLSSRNSTSPCVWIVSYLPFTYSSCILASDGAGQGTQNVPSIDTCQLNIIKLIKAVPRDALNLHDLRLTRTPSFPCCMIFATERLTALARQSHTHTQCSAMYLPRHGHGLRLKFYSGPNLRSTPWWGGGLSV